MIAEETILKPEEVRLGNWVQEKGHYTTICQLTFEQWAFDHLEPILLTPEILEKCGFTFDFDVYFRQNNKEYEYWDQPMFKTDDDFAIKFYKVFENVEEGWYLVNGSGMDEYKIGKPFQYLHQLQNLYFCLTGEELSHDPI